jgi:threonine synthase
VPMGTDETKLAGAAAYGAIVVRVRGTYDQVNRLCGRLADEERWGFVNFTLRPYYAEGSKTILFECAEQLGWRFPGHVVVPVGSGALLTRTATAIAQLRGAGLVEDTSARIHAAQPAGCAPVSDAVLADYRAVRPVRDPATVARSLAIGAPADGDGSVAAIRASGGSAASVDDAAVLEGCALLARTEGVLGEPAAGVVVATARELSRRGAFDDGGTVVLFITGNAYKGALEASLLGAVIDPDADGFRAAYAKALA